MVKHPLQNLGASSGPQPSGSKDVMRTQTRLRLVQKTQFSVTHKHTEEGWNQCSWHAHGFHFFFWVTLGSQPRNAAIWCTTKRSSAGQTLTPETSRILIGQMLTVEHPDWANCKVTAQAGKRARLQCRIPRDKMSPLHDYSHLIHTTWKYLVLFCKLLMKNSLQVDIFKAQVQVVTWQ